MIPKTIHYCWFGGKPLPKMAKKCIKSWKKYCPEYEIIEWNEKNFDINCCDYVKEAYEAKKWAFVTDYIRLKVLYEYGGIYMDTDVEIIKPIDNFLKYKAFSGFENETDIPTGIIGSEPKLEIISELMNDYFYIHFLKPDGKYDEATNVGRITKKFSEYGLARNNSFQIIKDFAVFPKDYFCPKDSWDRTLKITENTVSIHHFDGSWVHGVNKFKMKLKDFLGEKWVFRIKRLKEKTGIAGK